jgi:hypothetical protein
VKVWADLLHRVPVRQLIGPDFEKWASSNEQGTIGDQTHYWLMRSIGLNKDSRA